MKSKHEQNSRRSFLKNAAMGSAAMTSAPYIISASTGNQRIVMGRDYNTVRFAKNDQIQIGVIGVGIKGIQDTNVSLQIDGVQLLGACDLYTGRLDHARELWGKDIFTTRDYREILNRKDIDAVIIAVPDHWHKQIFLDALKAGKAVYCEKPMVKEAVVGHEIIRAQKQTGLVCQIGSQGMSSLGNEKAKQLYKDGAIGDIVMLEMHTDRYSAEGAWEYPIPPDANPETVDFDTFLGNAPKVPYDNTRFFRWRNYRDYGTGAAGDLFVHAFSTLNYILGSHGPERAMATGGLRYWKDGREVPDVSVTLYDYPKTDAHAAFNAIFRVNFIAGSGGGSGFRLVGTEGALDVGQTKVTLIRSKLNMVPGPYSMSPYAEATREKIREEYARRKTGDRKSELSTGTTVWEASKDYKGAQYDHVHNFYKGIRGTFAIEEDVVFGLRAAGAALLANESYYRGAPVLWDPEGMKLI